MLFAIETLLRQHDPSGVVLTAVICLFAAFTGIALAARARLASGRRAFFWSSLAAVTVGLGIWATHFVAILAFDPGFLLGFDIGRTLLSLIVAVVITGVGIAWSRQRPMMAGVVIGFGIAAMHYLGMSAIALGGEILWNWHGIGVSVVLGSALSAAAFTMGARSARLRGRMGAAILLTAAICTLHFTGMGAADMSGCFALADSLPFQRFELSLAIAIGSLLLLALAFLVRLIDARDAHLAALADQRVRDLANMSLEGIATVEDGRIVDCNASFKALTGATRGEDLADLLGSQTLRDLREASGALLKCELVSRNGISIPVEVSLRSIGAGNLTEAVALRDLRERIAAEEAATLAHRKALAAEQRFRFLIQSVTDYAIYMLDPEGRVANWNAGAERAKGYTAHEIVGVHFSRFFSAEDREAGLPEQALANAIRLGKFESEGWRYRKDGSRFWAGVLIEPIHDDSGAHIGFAKVTHDNTRQREAAESIALAQRNLNLALDNMSQGLALFDAGERLTLMNGRLAEILGIPDCDLQIADLCRTLAGLSAAELTVQEEVERILPIWRTPVDGELVMDFADGRTIRIVHRAVRGGGSVSTFEDISENRRSEEKIVHMARHDALTGLPNRASFAEHIGWTLDRAEDAGVRVAVLGIDLDRFKEINDHLGHAVGDAVLRTLSDRMRDCLQGDEFVARFGGDEFAAYLSYDDDAELEGFIARLETAICEKFMVGQNELGVGASIGVALYPADGDSADKLISNADMAMYRAKASISRSVCFYEAEMDEQARERRLLARDLWSAIDNGELYLHHQIQKAVATGATTGFEVLLRWNHPTRGPISPAEFIPIAEECGAILPIGEWVLRSACHQAAQWKADTRIAVNLSPVQLGNGNLVDMVTEVLRETGLDPARLELEVTESAIIADKARALHILRQIKALGVTIAIDDFGTGYSSLETLRAFPFDKIKLDRSFIREVETNVQSKAIIRAILALGRSLEVPVLAEGVETPAQLSLLRVEGCDEAQGFLLGRPHLLMAEPEGDAASGLVA